jgi:hypothetical protein
MDTNLVLRAGDTNLTADESLTAVLIGPMVRPLYLHVLVPAVSSGDQLDVELEFNDDGSTQIDNMNMKQITALGHFTIPFFTLHKYILVKLNETDNGGPNFGAVKVWIDNSSRYTGAYLT